MAGQYGGQPIVIVDPSKERTKGRDALSMNISAAQAVSDIVKTTLGPKVMDKMLVNQIGDIVLTNDCATILKEMSIENTTAKMVVEVARTQENVAGDGTTTATVLAQSIVREGMKSVAAGMNTMDLNRGIHKAVEAVVAEIKTMAQPCTTSEAIAQVGTISANSDAAIGDMIAEAMERVSTEGVITVEEGSSLQDELVVVDGMEFDRGYLSPYFVTNQEKMIYELETTYVLL